MSDSKIKGNLETEPVDPYWNLYTTTLQQSADAENRALTALQERYGQERAALEKSRARAQENARVSYAKLQKYLPTILKQQGLAGLGVSQSAALRMNNTHANRMGQIESDYASALDELSARYGESRAAIENQRAERGLAAYQTYVGNKQHQEELAYTRELNDQTRADNLALQEQTRADNLALQEQTRADNLAANAKETFIELLNSGGFKNSEEMYRYLEENRDVLGDLYNTTKMTADSYAADIDELYEWEEETESEAKLFETSKIEWLGNLKDGKNIKVTIDENAYKVEIGNEITDDGIKSAARKIKNGQAFTLNGDLYFKYENKIYSIQKRRIKNAGSSNGYNALLNYYNAE